ncbi:MAG: Ig-like domain-containing protein, partial [Bacteroidota bacterium]
MSHAAPFLLAFGAALFMHGLHGEALHAQDFRVESTEPASGTVGVPLQQRIQFTFTEAITVSTDWDGVFIAEPRRTRTIGTVSLCINSGDPCNGGTEIIPRFVRFEVRHEADTDYTWFVESAETPGGTVQAEPFTLHYTTAPTIGDRQVAGTVQAAAGKHSMMPPAMARLAHAIRPALIQAERQTLGGTADGPAATRILLLRGPSLSEVLWRIDGGISRRGDGGFTIPYVRPGTYYPVAVRYTDGTATEIAALGFLDANGDTVPDTVTVEGDADVTDLSLTLFPYPLRTGRTGLEQAIEAAAASADTTGLFASSRLISVLSGSFRRSFGPKPT